MVPTTPTPNLISPTDLFKISWNTTKDRLKNYWFASLALVGIAMIGVVVFGLLTAALLAIIGTTGGSPVAIGGFIFLILAAIIGIVALGLWWNIIVLEIITGQDEPNLSTAAKRTKSMIRPLFIVQLLISLITLGSAIFFLLPLFYLFVPLMFVIMVFYFEATRGINVFYRTLDLVKGVWWATLGRVSLLWLTGYVAQLLISGIFNETTAMLLSFSFSIIWLPFSIAYLYHLYQSLVKLNPPGDQGPTKHSGWLILSAVGWAVALVATISIVNFLAANPEMKDLMRQVFKLQSQLQNPETRRQLEEFSTSEKGQLEYEQMQKLMEQEGFNPEAMDDTMRELNRQLELLNQQSENNSTAPAR